MNKEEKEKLKKQVEDFLEHSDALSIYQIHDRFPISSEILSPEKFGQMLEEWCKDKNSFISKKDNNYIHKNNIEKTLETDYYDTVVDWLNKKLNMESQKLNHSTAVKEEKGVHHWRYPDIVGIKKINYLEKSILKVADLTGQKYFPEIWSFEVKKDLDRRNIRSYFFECLSNSGWANRRYVVAVTDLKQNAKIVDEVIPEFRKLSLRYNVGLIQIKTVDTRISEGTEGSSILIECPRQDLDLEIMNDLCKNWSEFKNWLEDLQ